MITGHRLGEWQPYPSEIGGDNERRTLINRLNTERAESGVTTVLIGAHAANTASAVGGEVRFERTEHVGVGRF